ncbi:MAG TPA: phosphatidylserine decarboxylase family protein [Gemmatimonadaceae bacterium]|nr:phosphatidylserine decarboxylase family protein [Gemmatimonadaceae bacterium]
MRIAREGVPFIAIAAVLALAAILYAARRGSWPAWLLSAVLVVVTVWVVYFFRDPERTGERGDRVVTSPADGKVVLITEVDEPAFIHGRAMRVSIFMNVFNVHVNRYPVSGTVKYVQYNPGKFLNAAVEKSSLENEQRSVGIESGPYRILVRQIAGLIARRIVTYSREGERVEQGERMGLIRFGSRVDVFLPTDATVKVKIGDLTTAGSTTIAELPAR